MVESEANSKLQFNPFTRESLTTIEGQIAAKKESKKQERNKHQRLQEHVQEEDEQQHPKKYESKRHQKRNKYLEAGVSLPIYMKRTFPNQLYGKPIEDIDEFYHDKQTFVVVNRSNEIFRFSATKAMWMMDPFNFLRHWAIYIMVHPIFNVAIFVTVLINCIIATQIHSVYSEDLEFVFMAIYTLELIIKLTARGFILEIFTYLRDPWNWLDFLIVISAYATLFLGDVLFHSATLRAFRVLRALKAAAFVRGLKISVGVAIESARTLKNVFLLMFFVLSVFAIVGLQLYKGSLTRKCIITLPEKMLWKMTQNEVDAFRDNASNWYHNHLCGNFSGAMSCPENYTCYEQYGPNPAYGYTSFDTFGWALLSVFRLMTLDFWEDLYSQVLQTMGPLHVVFFIVVIFICSFYLVNLILALLTMSYAKMLNRKKLEKQEEFRMIEKENQRRQEVDFTISSKEGVTEGQEITVDESDKEYVGRCLKCIDRFCVWNCCSCWLKFQKFLCPVVYDPFFELFIAICIVLNTVFLAMDNSNLSPEMTDVLSCGNYFFMVIYTIEAILKIFAGSPKNYFKVGWNIFDFIIVVFGLLDLCLEGVQGLYFLAIFRALRILRIFEFAKSWPTFGLLVSIMGRTLGALGYLSITMGVIIFMFALAGMLLFSYDYENNAHSLYDVYDGQLPRWHFLDFFHSFLAVFRVLTGEWIETLWDCLEVSGALCLPFFLTFAIIGNLVVFNLFIALLICKFESKSLSYIPDNKNATVTIDRFKRLLAWINQSVCKGVKNTIRIKVTNQTNEHDEENLIENQLEMRDKKEPLERTVTSNDRQEIKSNGEEEGTKTDEIAEEEERKGEVEEPKVPSICCLDCCYQYIPFCAGKHTPFWNGWYKLRLKMMTLVEKKYFEIVIFAVILISCVVLTQENKSNKRNKTVNAILISLDHIITLFFLTEMIIKWLALGYRKYFTNVWCWLDFIINLFLIICIGSSLAGASHLLVFQSMKATRSLRLLRIVARIEGLRVVAKTLIEAIPSIFKVLIVNLIIWLMFSIIGVQLFGGKFYKCETNEGEPVDLSRAWQNYLQLDHFPNITVGKKECEQLNLIWKNSEMNFDNVGNGYLALLQVATFKGWIPIMADASDTTERDIQPKYEANVYMYLYFVAFIIAGSFFGLNLFTGVIVDNFKRQKIKADGPLEMFMTEDQKIHYKALKLMGPKKLAKAIPKPTFPLQTIVYNIVTHRIFNIIVLIVILLNMIFLAMEHYQITATFRTVLTVFDVVFIILFSIEIFLKIIAFPRFYFKDPWNVFDIVVLTLCIFAVGFRDLNGKYFISPPLFRALKVGHLLRLTKLFKGIRTLLTTLTKSLPALTNISLFLFLVMFIYAIFGMSFFMNVKKDVGLDDIFNFENFGHSIIVLLQMTTSAGWDGILIGLSNQNDCTMPNTDTEGAGDCGNSTLAIAYLVSYLFISFSILIHTYIAVILDNYNRAIKEEEELTDDDYNLFYEIWQKYDPMCTGYMKQADLHCFLAELEKPPQFNRPTKYRIVATDIPISNGDQFHCVHVFDALVKDFFARRGYPVEESNGNDSKTHPPGVTTLRQLGGSTSTPATNVPELQQSSIEVLKE